MTSVRENKMFWMNGLLQVSLLTLMTLLYSVHKPYWGRTLHVVVVSYNKALRLSVFCELAAPVRIRRTVGNGGQPKSPRPSPQPILADLPTLSKSNGCGILYPPCYYYSPSPPPTPPPPLGFPDLPTALIRLYISHQLPRLASCGPLALQATRADWTHFWSSILKQNYFKKQYSSSSFFLKSFGFNVKYKWKIFSDNFRIFLKFVRGS